MCEEVSITVNEKQLRLIVDCIEQYIEMTEDTILDPIWSNGDSISNDMLKVIRQEMDTRIKSLVEHIRLKQILDKHILPK
ncbi:MAG: hypothetical protein ACXWFB_05965 [Nitrososphaeraceae archaeon]